MKRDFFKRDFDRSRAAAEGADARESTDTPEIGFRVGVSKGRVAFGG